MKFFLAYALKAVLFSAVWISPADLQKLPTSGAGWNTVVKAAGDLGSPNMTDQNNNHDVNTLALTYVALRTNDAAKISKAKAEVIRGLNSEHGGRTLAIGRNLCAYVVAADLLDAQFSAQDRTDVKNQIRALTNRKFDGETIKQTHERRPNNWGTHCGASRLAAAIYLNDTAERDRCVVIFKGWLGDRSSYSGFKFGSLSWQADPSKPVPVNPLGATKSGKNIDGGLPDELRRGGSFPKFAHSGTNYSYEALQGALVQAEILRVNGYDSFSWSDGAILRAFTFLQKEAKAPAEGDDAWQPYIVNAVYGTNLPESSSAKSGKNMGWTSWTHQ